MSTFNDQGFEKKLLGLKDSQESISTLSDWCLQNRQHHKKIVATWLSVLKKVRVENRLTLFYLANDVVQYSKRKNYDFVESWGTALQKATTMVRHDKVIDRIMRIFKIWGERNVYSEEFLTDLRGLLTAKKATPATPQAAAKQPEQQTASTSTTSGEFHQSILFTRINKCKELEDDTDLKLKVVNDCKLINLNDLDAFRAMLKDRKHADGVAGDLDQAVKQVENYTKALEVEILERKAVIDLLQQATKFYENEKADAKTVFNAYRNFGSRVKSLKRKLDELIPTLSSPVPSPDVNAPSPSPDLDLDLPNDEDLSGIVELLEDIEEAPAENDSDTDDLMSIISYHSSDEENPKFSYFELLRMPIHLRRRQLPLPNPTFSDSDLTELDDSFEDVDDSNNSFRDFKRTCSHVQTPIRASGISMHLGQDLQGTIKPSNSVISNQSSLTQPSKSMTQVISESGITESSTANVFKEPVLKKLPNSADKPLKNIAEANCPLVNDALRLSHEQNSLLPVDVSESSSMSLVSSNDEIKSNSNLENSISNGTFLDLDSDFLPSDEDLTGLLECLVDDPINADALGPAECSSPVSEANEAND